MNDFTRSLSDWFKEKTSSSLYFTYFIFVVAWNWETFYTLFFEDAALFKSPRIEYISANLKLNICTEFWCGPLADFITNSVWHIGVPAMLTFFAVKYFPQINAWAHGIEVKNYFERRRAYDTERVAYEEGLTIALMAEAEQKQKQKTVKEFIQKAQTQEEKWDFEFQKIDEEDTRAIQNGFQCVYEKNGYVTTNASQAINTTFKYIPHGLYGRLDSLGLIKRVEGSSGRIEFTEKGKYFIRQLQKQKKL